MFLQFSGRRSFRIVTTFLVVEDLNLCLTLTSLNRSSTCTTSSQKIGRFLQYQCTLSWAHSAIESNKTRFIRVFCNFEAKILFLCFVEQKIVQKFMRKFQIFFSAQHRGTKTQVYVIFLICNLGYVIWQKIQKIILHSREAHLHKSQKILIIPNSFCNLES